MDNFQKSFTLIKHIKLKKLVLLLNSEATIALSIILLFTLLRLPYFTANAFVPDELWHTGYMQSLKININHIFNIPNYQGHGAGFWIFGKITKSILGKKIFIIALKLLSLMSLSFSAYYLYKIGEILKADNKNLILLCFLTTPMAWWGGKLIFPELYSIFLLIFSLYYILKSDVNDNLKLPWIISGFTIGMKLTAIPSVIFIFLASLFFYKIKLGFNKKFFNYSLSALIWVLIGFVICNPFLIWKPYTFFDELILNSSYKTPFSVHHLIEHYSNIISNNSFAWDIIFFGGINESVIPITSFLLTITYLLLATPKNWKITLSSILSYIAFILMITFNQKAVSYYFFQSMIIPFSSMLFIQNNKKIKTAKLLCLSIIIINFFTIIPNIERDNKIRFKQAELLEQWEINTNCVKDILNNIKPVNLIINNAGAGGNYNRKELIDFQYISSKLGWIKYGLNSKELSIISGNSHEFNYSFIKNNLKTENFNSPLNISKARRIIVVEGKWTYNVKEYIDYNKKFLQYLEEQLPQYKITEELLGICGENDIWIIYLK